MSNDCEWCRVEHGSLADYADEYCDDCGTGYCLDCAQDGALIFDDEDLLICEDCVKARLTKREPVIATVVLAGIYNGATSKAVEDIVNPRTGASKHQREVE